MKRENDVVPFSNRLMEKLSGYGLNEGQINAVRSLVEQKIEDIEAKMHDDRRRAVQAERDACSLLCLRAESNARTQKNLRADLSQIIKERGIA